MPRPGKGLARGFPVAVVALLGALAGSGEAAWAQGAPAGAAATDTVCARPAFRRFDFWAGHWTVKDTAGNVMGTSRVERAVGGCALHEHWASGKTEIGESFTTFSPLEGKWHQLYIGTGGYVVSMSGGFEGDRLVLTTQPHATRRDPGARVVERWSWTPLDPNHVRQAAEVSSDGGATWKPQFNGLYERSSP